MKRVTALLLAAMMIITTGLITPAMAAEDDVPETYSNAYVVMDAKTGQVLLQKNMYEKEYPASITKILTTALGLTYAKPEDRITVSQETVSDVWKWGETTHLALEPGEIITLKDALYGAMVESANDCANAIAQAVSGNLTDFAELMNQQVAALGLSDTHFTNAHGLPDKDHYTTAYDMARITRWAMTVPGFEEYFCATEYTIPKTNKKDVARNIGTHHHMLVESAYYYPYAKGGKLGWTTEAQHTAVTWAEKDGLSLLCVVLDCSDKWGKYKDTIVLFDYCFERYSMVSVKTDEIAAYDIPVGSLTNTAGMVHIAATGDLDVLVPKGTAVESIALKYNIPSRYKVGERIDPQVELWCGGELVGTFPMEYTVETYAPVEDVPKDDVTTAGSGSVVLTVLKWIGIVLGALIVILFVLRAYFMARRRRRAKQRRRAQRRRMN